MCLTQDCLTLHHLATKCRMAKVCCFTILQLLVARVAKIKDWLESGWGINTAKPRSS